MLNCSPAHIFIVAIALLGESGWSEAACPEGKKSVLKNCVLDVKCPPGQVYADKPPSGCKEPKDPLNRPPRKLESWFTEEVFNDLFPKANLGLGPNKCLPFSYKAFVIAARYFPEFGTEDPLKGNDGGIPADQHYKRDLASFFAHAIQETGENDASLYASLSKEEADACFYRGGLFNWFEGGPVSAFLPPGKQGKSPTDGESCTTGGRYCVEAPEYNYFFPCAAGTTQSSGTTLYKGCYFGRGALQISYNFNYGQFQRWLELQGLGSKINVLQNPNLVISQMEPPLALMASLWFYMTPQPPKPAIHDIVIGNWEPGKKNQEAGYTGPVFGPSSLIINNECNGEDPGDPGGAGESRRIKAFKWFCDYFGVPHSPKNTGKSVNTLSCKDMPQKFDSLPSNQSYQPDWSTIWQEKRCDCAPAGYGGVIPYFQPGFYPQRFVSLNEANRKWCVDTIYKSPSTFYLDNTTSACLLHP